MADEYSKHFDTGTIIHTKDLGYDKDYEIMVQQNWEGGWTAICPSCELVETGHTREEALRFLLDNLKVQRAYRTQVREQVPPEDHVS
ncbi:MAG TPA: hypothetical protein VEI97_11385, partial [bacterium]|nr:hypothetical protein [bacterium]